MVRFDQASAIKGEILSITDHAEKSMESIIDVDRVRIAETTPLAIYRLRMFTRPQNASEQE